VNEEKSVVSMSKSDYCAAASVFLFVLVVYVLTLAPTVTFWDAGEFIATSHILGIPHPPGTPLFVLIGRVWTLLPLFSVAREMNLLAALCGATSAALICLVVSRILKEWVGSDRGISASVVVYGGGVSAAIASSFLITVWDNTTETEVYILAIATLSLFAWLALRWRDNLSRDKRTNIIVLMGFLAGLSVGNHLMALLVGPSVILYVLIVDHRPLTDARTLIAIVLFFLLGLSVHIYLPVRAALNPSINEADPSTWNTFWEVLSRKQYGSRSMLIRTSDFFQYQIPLYFIYFSDQFGRAWLVWPMSALGLLGIVEHFRKERKSFYYFALLFLLTSLGLVIYLNFKIGHTQALAEVPDPALHEVRERDYFFIVSFLLFGMWIGVGLASLFNMLRRNFSKAFEKKRALVYGLGIIVFTPALLPMIFNHERSDRSNNYIAYDYAYNILQSVDPYGVIFTNGDNDTFPLWFLQEVIELRKDVTVVNLSLLNTPWYIKQIRDRELPRPEELSQETRAFFEKEVYDLSRLYPEDNAIVRMKDDKIDLLFPQRIPEPIRFVAGGLTHEYPRGTIFFVKDIMILHMLEANNWRRPIYFAVTVSDNNKVDLQSNLVMEGLVYRIEEVPADSLAASEKSISYIPETKTYINKDKSRHLLNDVYKYRGISDDTVYKTPNTQKLLNNYAASFSYLGRSFLADNDLTAATECYEMAYTFTTNNTRFLYLIASLYAQNGQGEKADERFREFVGDGPVDPRYLQQMAVLFLREGDTTRGTEYLEETLRASPDDKPAYQLLDKIYTETGDSNKVNEIQARWQTTHPGDSLR